ncbi:UNVERIFIED_CONTAM: protein transport protein SEC31B [Sesamum calycinum]|uniref:Protein transport protein SEC31B n=1 Tax=Sesamum calycinum TaxID=2727403 RepID=A0AAW2RAU8_9LAMI
MAWCIKSVNRSASSAFSPEGVYMAAGTMAGAVDLQFSSTANLDIFELDFVSDDRQLILAGSAPSSERFNRISWSKASGNSEEYSLGLIAGGLVDGNIGLWNPKPLISPHKKVLIQVRGLEFNSLSPNLLASGADEGDICIWDVSKPSEPSHLLALKMQGWRSLNLPWYSGFISVSIPESILTGNRITASSASVVLFQRHCTSNFSATGSATQGEISYLSWNSKVQMILASTSYNGTTVVWDLKKQKPVISFSDSVRRRCSVLQWNPDVATQLIVASDEDSSPSLRLWDMRNIMSPVKEFVGHTKGVIAMSWCPIDSSYLLTCAKDNRTICWDTLSGEIVAELPAGTNWNFDVHWYSKVPGVISASSFDGKIGIYNVEGCGRYGLGESQFGSASFRAPKWYNCKAGVTFGFGGKLVSFHSTESRAGSSEVYVHNIAAEHGLASRSSEFEAALKNGDKLALKLLCERKSQESESDEERETWGFMKVMFTEDGTARSKLLSHLGFVLPAEENGINKEVSEQVNALGLDESLTDKEGSSGNKESTLFATDNGEDFFNNLPSPRADTPSSTSKNEFAVPDSVKESKQEMNDQEEASDPSFDDAVQRALVVGDYKGTVAQCISANRWADALVIAHVGSAALWERTRDQFLKTSHSPYLKVVVSAMVNNDLMSLANTRPLKSWKETLALFCTFAQSDEWTLLCDTLAARLMAANDTAAATLCYICAGNIDKAVEMWSKNLTTEHDRKPYVDRLQDLMEKTIVFALATGQKRFSASLCKLVEKYAEILASQGLLTTAMEYLNLLGTEELSTELMILRDRIALSTQADKEIEKTIAYDNTHLQSGSPYSDQSGYGVADASQRGYYPDAASLSQTQPTVPSSPYTENYQQPSAVPFGRGYNAPPTFPQARTQPSLFVPSPAVPPPMGNFPPPPVHAQPPAKFVPANPPMLKNLEQYQQPSSLGSQLYPGAANSNYQAGPPGVAAYGATSSQLGTTPRQMMPQVLAPTPTPRGFMPVSSSGVQRPGMNPMQPPSPTQPAPVQPPFTPAAPHQLCRQLILRKYLVPILFSNAPPFDLSQQKPVIATLTRLFNETSEALGGSRANPAKKREIEDNSKKLGALFAKLNSGDISKNAAEKLVQLCQALDNGDFGTALQIQVMWLKLKPFFQDQEPFITKCPLQIPLQCSTKGYTLFMLSRLIGRIALLVPLDSWNDKPFWQGENRAKSV